MVFLITYARASPMTTQCDLEYNLMNSIVPAISVLLTLGSLSGSIYQSLSLFCNQRCISTDDDVGRWLASGFLGLWLKPAVLCQVFHWHSCHLALVSKTSKPLWTVLSLLSAKQFGCFKLNLSHKYISCSHKATIKGPYAQFTCLIISVTLYFIGLLHNVLAWVSSISHILYQSFPPFHWLLWSQGLIHLVHCPDCSLLWLFLLWCLLVPPVVGHCCLSQALLHLLVTKVLGILSPA